MCRETPVKNEYEKKSFLLTQYIGLYFYGLFFRVYNETPVAFLSLKNHSNLRTLHGQKRSLKEALKSFILRVFSVIKYPITHSGSFWIKYYLLF